MKYRHLFIFILFLFGYSFSGAYVRVAPPLLFLDEPKRSVPLQIFNTSEKEVEVWIEIKYGYTTTDDSNKIVIKYTDKLDSDDQSVAGWTTFYPDKFILKPKEKRHIRVMVNASSGIPDGEYWARILVNSKPIGSSLKLSSTPDKPKMDIVVQNQQSIPFHYRKGKVSTSVEITESPKIQVHGKVISFLASMQRYGNSSYWGRMNFELVNEKGKVVKKSPQHFVVYKKISYIFNIGISDIPKGNYVLNTTAETVRMDDAAKYVLKTAPKNWKYNIRID